MYTISSVYWKFCQNSVNMLSLWPTTIYCIRTIFPVLI